MNKEKGCSCGSPLHHNTQCSSCFGCGTSVCEVCGGPCIRCNSMVCEKCSVWCKASTQNYYRKSLVHKDGVLARLCDQCTTFCDQCSHKFCDKCVLRCTHHYDSTLCVNCIRRNKSKPETSVCQKCKTQWIINNQTDENEDESVLDSENSLSPSPPISSNNHSLPQVNFLDLECNIERDGLDSLIIEYNNNTPSTPEHSLPTFFYPPSPTKDKIEIVQFLPASYTPIFPISSVDTNFPRHPRQYTFNIAPYSPPGSPLTPPPSPRAIDTEIEKKLNNIPDDLEENSPKKTRINY
eukprot:TRINITY_DN5193_c0_g1_i1.p1 TRINITY_DN5193_c0_g1~~TRINITY_DN5193_c0_g1_i1.p1  ORF type:complete len:294 (-),score=47.72 TRINITY_DN5193_c0_g1_i1:130-1011(-)